MQMPWFSDKDFKTVHTVKEEDYWKDRMKSVMAGAPEKKEAAELPKVIVKPMKIVEHTVKSGESLLGISIVYGCTLRSLLQLNNFPGEDVMLSDGEIIKVQVREDFQLKPIKL